MDVFDWLFIFPLPHFHGSDAKDQALFEKRLGHNGVSAVDVLKHAFHEVLDDDESSTESLHRMVAAARPDGAGNACRPAAAGEALQAPLLGGGRVPVPAGRSLAHAQQSAIKLFLATLGALDAYLRKAVQGSGVGEAKTQVEVLVFPEQEGKKVFVAVGLGAAGAEVLAEEGDYPVQLSRKGAEELKLRTRLSRGDSLVNVKFCRSFAEMCERHEVGTGSQRAVLRNIDRVRLLFDRVTDLVDFHILARYGLLLDYSPLHGKDDLTVLQEHFRLTSLDMSLKKIEYVRQHFGEEVAIYFLFLNKLIWFAVYLAGFALVATIWEAVAPSDNVYFAFSFIVFVWFRVFTLHWSRQESHYNVHWGVREHHQSQLKPRLNLRYHGNASLLSQPKQGSFWEQAVGMVCSVSLTLLFVAALLLLVCLEHWGYHVLAEAHRSDAFWEQALSTGLGVVTGIQIKVVDQLWDSVSNAITDLECRSTEARFLMSKRIKATVVKFITSVSSTLYFAIVQPAVSDGQDRLLFRRQLAQQMIVTFLTRFIFLGSVNRIIKTYAVVRFNVHMHNHAEALPFIEFQSLLTSYGHKDLNEDFLDVLIPLSIVVLFGMVGPPVVFLLVVVTAVSFRSDAWKLTHTMRRPYPRVVGNIGFFGDVMELLGRLTVFTHCCLFWVLFWRGQASQSEGALFIGHALFGLLLWAYLGWLVPAKSDATRLEEREHALQRRALHRRKHHTNAADRVHVQLSALEQAGSADFATWERPKPSRRSNVIKKEGFHLGGAV